MWGKEAQDAILLIDNTYGKHALLMQAEIADGKFIAGVVGLSQLLEEYAQCSLDAQNLCFFPTSVLESSNKHMNNIKKWEKLGSGRK